MLEKINSIIKQALKDKDTVKLQALRSVLSQIQVAQKVNTNVQLSDIDIINIINKSIKMRTDSIELFTKGNRNDLVEIEKSQLTHIVNLLPPMMSENDMTTYIKYYMYDYKLTSISDMKIHLPILREKLQGQCDISKIAFIFKQLLENKNQ